MSATSPGIGAPDQNVAELIRAVTQESSDRRRASSFSLTAATGMERFLAPILGIYLGYVTARVAEVFPVTAVPRLPMVILLCFIAYLVIGVPGSGWRQIWHASLPTRCVALLYTLAWVTMPIGVYMSRSYAMATNRFLIAVACFAACIVILRDRRNLRVAIAWYVVIVAAMAAYVLATYDLNALAVDADGFPLDPDSIRTDRFRVEVGISLDPNDWGAVLVTTIPLALYLAATAKALKLLWWAAAITMTAAIVPTQSRGSLIGLVAVAMTVLAFGASGWRRIVMMLLVLAGGAAFVTLASEGQMDRFTDFSTTDYNVQGQGRLMFWTQGVVWSIKRPWGYGIGNFGTYWEMLNGRPKAAHSSWIQYLVELGVLGFATFTLLVWSLIRGLKRHRRANLHSNRPEAVLAGFLVAALIGVLATGSFLSNAYHILMYMTIGFAAAALLGAPGGPLMRDLAEWRHSADQRRTGGIRSSPDGPAPAGGIRHRRSG